MRNFSCKYKPLEISRLLSHANTHTIELSRTFLQVTVIKYVLVVVVVDVGATTVLKAIPRESYCGRLLISWNFGDSSEIVSVVSWNIEYCGLN